MWKKIFIMILLVSLGAGTLLPGVSVQKVQADEMPVQQTDAAQSAPAPSESAPAAPAEMAPGSFTASVIHVPAAFTNSVSVVLENYYTEAEIEISLGMDNGYTATVSADPGTYNLVGLNVEGENPEEWQGTVWETKYVVSSGADSEITIRLKSDKVAEESETAESKAAESKAAQGDSSSAYSFDSGALIEGLTGSRPVTESTASETGISKPTSAESKTAESTESNPAETKPETGRIAYAFPVLMIIAISLGCALVFLHGRNKKKGRRK